LNQGIQFLIPTGAPAARPQGAAGGQGGAAAGPPGAFRSMLLSALQGGTAATPQAPATGLVAVPAVPPEGVAAAGPTTAAVPPDALLPGPEGAVPAADPQVLPTAPFPLMTETPPQAQSPQPPVPQLTRPEAAALAALLAQTGATAEGEPLAGAPAEPVPETPDDSAPEEALQVMTSAEAMVAAATGLPPAPAPAPEVPAPAQQTQPRSDAPVVTTPPEPSAAQLEAFVRQATALVGQTGQQPAPEAETPETPRFADLLQLVAEAEGQPQQAQAPAQGADAQPQSRKQGEAPTQPAPQAEFPAPAAAEPVESVAALASGPEPSHGPADLKPHQPVTQAADVSAPAESKPPVQPEPVLRQLTRFVKVMVQSDRSEVRLNLHPEDLGTIVVKLVLEGGAVKAHLTAQDAAVKHVLETNLDQLKTRFANQGITVNEVHVAVGDNGSSFSQPHHSHQGGRQEQNQPQTRPGHRQVPQPEEPQPAPQPQTPAPWTRRWSGSRINSLA
jgi:flagellar hook-length control protein FliK